MDTFQLFNERGYDRQIFTVIIGQMRGCALCGEVFFEEDDPRITVEIPPTIINGCEFTRLGAYPQELELLEAQHGT